MNMNRANFSPESTNPRMRRAYAHAVIEKAFRSADLSDLDDAIAAVGSVGMSKKSKNSGFDKAIVSIALQDSDTEVIVNRGNKVLDTKETPRTKSTWVGTEDDPKDLVHARRYSPGFMPRMHGATMGITEVRSQDNGSLVNTGNLYVTNHEKSSEIDMTPRHIPITEEHTVDAVAIRRLPAEQRAEIAEIASKIV